MNKYRYIMLNDNKSVYIPVPIINKLLNINYKYISNKIFIKNVKIRLMMNIYIIQQIRLV